MDIQTSGRYPKLDEQVARPPMEDMNLPKNALTLGEDAKEQLLSANGGTTNTKGVVRLLGLSRQAVSKRRQLGKLIAMQLSNGEYAYPIWQFSNRRSLEGLERVLAELKNLDPWMQAQFMLDGNSRLNWETPLAALQSGKILAAIAAAREHGK